MVGIQLAKPPPEYHKPLCFSPMVWQDNRECIQFGLSLLRRRTDRDIFYPYFVLHSVFFQIHPVIFVSFWERNPSYPQSHLQLRPIYTGSPHCCTAKNAAVFFKQFAFDFTMVIYHAQTALYGQVAEAQDIRSLHREKHKHLRAPYTKPF